MDVRSFNKSIDKVFDMLLRKLGCEDTTDAILMNHWQEGIGARIQVTRRADGRSLTRGVRLDGTITL